MGPKRVVSTKGAMRPYFETVTRYSRVDGEEQRKKKAFLRIVLKLILVVTGKFLKFRWPQGHS